MNKVTEQGTMFVSKVYTSRGQVVKEEVTEPEQIEVRIFETEPAKVSATLGMTINLGNYESLRVDCGTTLPCYVEEIDDAEERAFRLSEQALFKRINEVKSNL